MTFAPPLSPSAFLRMGTVLDVLGAHNVRSVVEVGPGVGAMSWRIAQGREYRGYEPDPESFAVAADRMRGLPNVILSNSFLPEEPEVAVDALVAFEVLEHISDDERALRGWVKWVRPGGLVLLSVPAHQHRFGPMDTAVGHYRRYSKSELEGKLERAGLVDVEVRAYGMPAGYILDWVRQRVLAGRLEAPSDNEEGTKRSGRSFQPRRGVSSLVALIMTPFRLMQRPFAHTELGTGWIAWARRPS